MKVKDLIINACKLLDLKELNKNLENDSISIEEKNQDILNKLIIAFNSTISTIASQYIELIEHKNCNINSGFLPYSSITDKNIIEIKNIYDSNFSRLNYTKDINGIFVDANNVNIEYSYLPKDLILEDEIDYKIGIGDKVIAYGIVSEYYFITGDFESSFLWDKKFKDSLLSITRVKRNIIMPKGEFL